MANKKVGKGARLEESRILNTMARKASWLKVTFE